MPAPLEEVPGAIDPQDAFQLFSHELRLEILFALWAAPEHSLAFSEIRTAVGEQDSGRFTYHLEQLTDHFVAEADGEYVLQYAGHRVIDAIQSGVFHTSPTVAPVAAPGECARCGTTPTFEYDDHLARVTCGDCETKLLEYPFDPGGFQDRSVEAAIRAFDRVTKFKWRLASGGVCFVCTGRVGVDYADGAPDIEHNPRYEEFFAADHPVLLGLSCRNCSFYSYVPVGVRVLDDPTVAGALADRGLDVAERFLWELPFVANGDSVTVRGRDPWEVRIEVPVRDATLTVTLDEAASVASLTLSR